MGMIDRIAAFAGFERRNDAADPSWSAIAPGIGYPGALSARAAENLASILACVEAIGSALGYVPGLVYRIDADGNRAEALSHPLRRITRAGASGTMSWPDFVNHLVVSTLLTGNDLAEIVRSGNGQLAGFNWIPWGMVTLPASLTPWCHCWTIGAIKAWTRSRSKPAVRMRFGVNGSPALFGAS